MALPPAQPTGRLALGVHTYFLPRSPAEIWQAVGAHPAVLALEGEAPIPRNGHVGRAFAAERTADGFRLHATSTASGSTITGLAGAQYLDVHVTGGEDGSSVELSFRRGWPLWARMRALGTSLSLGLGLAWAMLGSLYAADRMFLVGLFMLLLLPALWRDVSLLLSAPAMHDKLRQLVETVFVPLSLPQDGETKSPYRERRLAVVGDSSDEE